MELGMRIVNFLSLVLVSVFVNSAYADKCGEFVYNKKGMLRKYEYLNLHLTENTKKHGSSSSTFGITTESTTASSDPGVYTGQVIGSSQSLSSWGECKFNPTALMDLFGSREEYKDYIAQNLEEVKKQMAQGDGGHLHTLAAAHHCEAPAFGIAAKASLVNIVDLGIDKTDEFLNEMNLVAQKACPSQATILF